MAVEVLVAVAVGVLVAVPVAVGVLVSVPVFVAVVLGVPLGVFVLVAVAVGVPVAVAGAGESSLATKASYEPPRLAGWDGPAAGKSDRGGEAGYPSLSRLSSVARRHLRIRVRAFPIVSQFPVFSVLALHQLVERPVSISTREPRCIEPCLPFPV